MLFLTLAGCLAPTTVGLHTDGYVAPAGSFDVAAGYGSTIETLDAQDGEQFGVAGVTAGWVPVDHLRIAGGVGLPEDLLTAELEAQYQVTGEGPLSVTVVAGPSVLLRPDSGEVGWWGARAGAVVSYELVPDLRPYAGAVVNPNLLEGDIFTFSDVSAGVTWRPTIVPGLAALVLAEGTWLHSFGTDGDGTYDLLVGAGMVGLTVTPKALGARATAPSPAGAPSPPAPPSAVPPSWAGRPTSGR